MYINWPWTHSSGTRPGTPRTAPSTASGSEIVYAIDRVTVVYRDDTRFDYGERRIRAFGRVDGKAYCIAIAPRDGTIRVLSARRMHEKEANRYGI